MKVHPSRVLIDTNLWVGFLRESNLTMRELLREDAVATHSCVIGELFVGSLGRRSMMHDFMQRLPKVEEAEPMEALILIERKNLWGIGLQWNDVLILASAKISGVKLWTLDKRLAWAAEDLGVAWDG
jgi:predicted nucleic acid-binding protein